jgi:hypothetical protein
MGVEFVPAKRVPPLLPVAQLFQPEEGLAGHSPNDCYP